MKQFRLLMAFILLGSFQIFANEATELIENLNRIYNDESMVSLKITFRVFENHYTTVPFEEAHGTYYKNKVATYSEIMGFTTISTGSEYILVNKEDKQILVTSIPQQKKPSMPEDWLKSIKSYKSFQNKSIGGNKSKCVFFFNASSTVPWEKIEIKYSSSTYIIEEMKMYFSNGSFFEQLTEKKYQKPRIDIVFSEVTTKPKFPKNIFNPSSYYTSDNGKYFPTRVYSGYDIINQKNSKR